MPATLSQLLALALEIRDETLPEANSAERVGSALESIIRAMMKPYDPDSAYETGQYVFFGDAVHRSQEAIGVGESPAQAPAKWRQLTNNLGLNQVLFNDPVADIIPIFNNGLIASLPDEPTDSSFPGVVVGPDGLLYKHAGSVLPDAPVANIIIDEHWIESEPDTVHVSAPFSRWGGTISATPNGNVRVVGRTSLLVGETDTYHGEQQLTDNSWRSYSGSSGVFSLSTALAGVSINSATGLLDTSGANLSGPVTVGVIFNLSGNQNELSVTIHPNVTIVQAGDYAWQKNNPPTTASNLDIWWKYTGPGDIEMALQVVGPSGLASSKSTYGSMSTSSYGNGFTKYTNVYGAPGGAFYRAFVRRVGTTTDLIVVDLPQLPTSGSVARSQFYPANT